MQDTYCLCTMVNLPIAKGMDVDKTRNYLNKNKSDNLRNISMPSTITRAPVVLTRVFYGFTIAAHESYFGEWPHSAHIAYIPRSNHLQNLGIFIEISSFCNFSINHFYLIFDYMLLMFLVSVTFVHGCYENYFLKMKCSVLTFVY